MSSPASAPSGHGKASKHVSSLIQKSIEPCDRIAKKSRKKRRRGKANEDSHNNDKHPTSWKDNSSTDLETTRRGLACPYYKRYPEKYRSHRICGTQCWDLVRGMKEHLYGVHAMPLHCRRCYTTFSNETQLTEHALASETCAVKPAISIEGFDKVQERALKSRRGSSLAKTDEEEWKAVYLILFPDSASSESPSPHYQDVSFPPDYEDVGYPPDYDDAGSEKVRHATPELPRSDQLDTTMRRELPRMLQEKLGAVVDSTFDRVEEVLKKNLDIYIRYSYLLADKSVEEHLRKRLKERSSHAGELTLSTPTVLISYPELAAQDVPRYGMDRTDGRDNRLSTSDHGKPHNITLITHSTSDFRDFKNPSSPGEADPSSPPSPVMLQSDRIISPASDADTQCSDVRRGDYTQQNFDLIKRKQTPHKRGHACLRHKQKRTKCDPNVCKENGLYKYKATFSKARKPTGWDVAGQEEGYGMATENDLKKCECAGSEYQIEVVRQESVQPDSESFRSTSGIATSEHNIGGRNRQSSHADQNCSPYSTGSPTSGTDNLDSVDGSSDDCCFDCESDIYVEKEMIVDRLMLCVHDMFTSPGSSAHNSCAGSGSHQAQKQASEPSVNSFDEAGKKRKESKESGDNNPDEENDGSRKRQKVQKDTKEAGRKNDKMLACPYYKNNPRKNYPSKPCSERGWSSVNRIKEHLHRVHRMPLYCRRCYLTFKTENHLDDHAQLQEPCPRGEARPMEGFNKEQEEKLRDRGPMFRAKGSEEKKWNTVYLILFPYTPLGTIPSPYYDAYQNSSCERTENTSTQSSELGRFQAYMKRELPVTIRRTLMELLDRNFVSIKERIEEAIEERIEHQLESIISEAQELCARTYHSSTQPSESSSRTIARPVEEAGPAENLAAATSNAWSLVQTPDLHMESLAQSSMAPDSSSSCLPELHFLNDSSNTDAIHHDSMHQSYPMDGEDMCFDEAWLQPDPAGESALEHLFPEYLYRDTDSETISPDPPPDDQPTEEYNGKGKGRANPDSNSDATHPYFGPFIPDR